MQGITYRSASKFICHCLDCKQTSGAPFSSNIIVAMKDHKIEGPVKSYESKTASGNTSAFERLIKYPLLKYLVQLF